MERAFESISSRKIVALIAKSKQRVVLAMPGITDQVAAALISACSRAEPPRVTVVVDCDETVCRLGYGSIRALQELHAAGVEVRQCPGIRLGLFICDERAWAFTPIAQYVQDEIHSDETPNAIVLGSAEADRLACRASATEAGVAAAAVSAPEAGAAAQAGRSASEPPHQDCGPASVEIGVEPVAARAVNSVARNLEVVPPVPFNISRQVRVFQPYVQYVNIKLVGCALQRRRVNIPKSIVNVGAAKEIKNRLRTIFALIDRESHLTSKALEAEVAGLRRIYTRRVGKRWQRVLLRARRNEFDAEVKKLTERVREHQERVKKDLQKHLDLSRKQVVRYFLPHIAADPPPELMAQLTTPRPARRHARQWLDKQLDRVFPRAEQIVKEMELNVQFSDVTYDSLNDPEFLEGLRREFEFVPWDKPFSEFRAAREREAARA
jgi:hypothetical protein